MTNGKKKGNRRERQLDGHVQKAGYRTYRPQESKWGETDMYGLFDIVAYRPDKPVAWLQSKSNAAVGINEWAEKASAFVGPYSTALMAVCYDREGWRLICPEEDGGGYQTVADGREYVDTVMGSAVVEYFAEPGGDS